MSNADSRVEIIYASTFRDFFQVSVLPRGEYRISDLFDDSLVCNWLQENAIKVSSVGCGVKGFQRLCSQGRRSC